MKNLAVVSICAVILGGICWFWFNQPPATSKALETLESSLTQIELKKAEVDRALQIMLEKEVLLRGEVEKEVNMLSDDAVVTGLNDELLQWRMETTK